MPVVGPGGKLLEYSIQDIGESVRKPKKLTSTSLSLGNSSSFHLAAFSCTCWVMPRAFQL